MALPTRLFPCGIEGKDKVPFDYVVEYLESTGSQWIDTGLYLNANTTTVICDTKLVNNPSNWSQVFGTAVSFNTNVYGVEFAVYSSYPNMYIPILPPIQQITYADDGNRHKLEINMPSKKVLKDGTQLGTFTFTEARSTGTIYLPYRAKQQFHGGQIYENGILVFDGIPVSKNGIGYMYDKVSGTLFANSGSGQFIIGPRK